MFGFKKKPTLSEEDLAYMSSLSQAALEKPTLGSQVMVWTIFLVLVWVIVWASYAELDKVVRAKGKVVPSSNVQVVQNLEGGIVEEIFVREGDKVKKGQLLLRLDNTLYQSAFGENLIKEYALKAKAARLEALATGRPIHFRKYGFNRVKDPDVQVLLKREKTLYQAKLKALNTTQAIYDQQIEQSRLDYQEAKSQLVEQKRTHQILIRRINLLKPLVRRGIAAEEDLLKLQQEESETLSKIKTLQNSLYSLRSKMKEVKQKKRQAVEAFRNKAHEELNDVLAQIEQLDKSKAALADRVRRTEVRSPVTGTIKTLNVTTIGGVVKPGSDMVEIVPDDDRLVIEAKVLPADIGFIRPGLKAKLKFTAYDFSIYGGLEGKVVQVSADSMTDEKGNSFFIVKVKTDKNYLGSEKNPLKLMPGMVASVDIVVGKHTVLQYLLKPIAKAKETALRES